MLYKRISICLLVLFLSSTAQSVEVAGVTVPDTTKHYTGMSLVLNGAGVRKKLFFKIYVAALFLPAKNTEVDNILVHDQLNKITMNFIYSDVSKEKMQAAWREGFKENLSAEAYQKIEERLNQFTAMFGDMRENDKVIFDYLPRTGTYVTINGEFKGIISGHDFNRGLLSVWLGKKPVTQDLKEALLGQ